MSDMADRISAQLFKLRKAAVVLLVIATAVQACSCSKDNTGFDGIRFDETRKITVLADYITDVNTDVTVNSSAVASFIHEAVLRDCNIDVEFIGSDKYSLLNGITADISYTENSDTLNTYYRMGAVYNIAPYLDQYGDSLGSLKSLLGEENIYSCTDDQQEVWYLTPYNFAPDSRVTFIRKDWLDKLGLDVPTTKDGLYSCLTAFRDNADLLLGDEASLMIPFFIDNEPNNSAKPLFDSCMDTGISDKDFYINGYCRATQDGYKDGLKILNVWYHQHLLPENYTEIRPQSKESYLPIENGYVGAFCAKSDYLYINGNDSHIKALHDNCGKDAGYIAVNCFENSNGEYTAWQEDYLKEGGNKVFIPATCEDPLACLIYLDWISDPENISRIRDIEYDDPFDPARYLLTVRGLFRYDAVFQGLDSQQAEQAEQARQTAMSVRYIRRGNKCVRYNSYYFKYVMSDIDYASIYPGSTKDFINNVIQSPEDVFDQRYKELFDEYGRKGSYVIYRIRADEWDKVMERGDLKPW